MTGLVFDGRRLLLPDMTAGESLTEGDALYISGVNTVKKTTGNLATGIGVADADASSGDKVNVVVFGVKTVTADGAINPGDRVVGATTAGRVVSGGNPVASVGALSNDLGHDGSNGLETTAAATYIDQGFVLGKAIGSASGAGDTLDILVRG